MMANNPYLTTPYENGGDSNTSSLDASAIQRLEGFRQRLQDINSTEVCIRKLSQEMLLSERQGLSTHFIDVWSNAIKLEKSPSRIVALFYVINDFIQNSYHKNPELLHIVLPHLKEACLSISNLDLGNALEECQRVISIWRIRCIFESKICTGLLKILHKQSDYDLTLSPDDYRYDKVNRPVMISLQQNGHNSDGYISPDASIISQNNFNNNENDFYSEINSYVQIILMIRKHLVDKVSFVKKKQLESEELMLERNNLLRHDHLTNSERVLQLEHIQKILQQNHTKQKVLLEMEWKMRLKLHSTLKSFSNSIEKRLKRIMKLHVTSENNLTATKQILARKSSII